MKRILLDLLLGHPAGIRPALLFRIVQQSYRLPASFSEPRPRTDVYRQLKAEGIERRSLSADELRSLGISEPVWENTMRQARRDLENDGLLDGDERGVWRLSAAGVEAALRRDFFALRADEQFIVAPQVSIAEQAAHVASEDTFEGNEPLAAIRALRSILVRRGQPAFRAALIDAYDGRCAISSCDAIDALEAAHLVPVAEGGRATRKNGLLLRADLHTLFDLNLFGIDPSARRVVLGTRLSGRFTASSLAPRCGTSWMVLGLRRRRSRHAGGCSRARSIEAQ